MKSLRLCGGAVHEREMLLKLIGILSAGSGRDAMFGALLPLLQHWSGCEAVGVRLRQGDDYPYFQSTGLSESFLTMESGLCGRDKEGQVLLGDDGAAVLECMCGAVIQGRVDVSQPCFTAKGSFWTNSTTAFLAKARRKGLPQSARNRCNQAGYESMALVPLCFHSKTFGLLQFNDKRTGRFTRRRIAFLEKMADNVALALSRFQAEQDRLDGEHVYRAMFYANNAIKLLVDPDTGNIVDANPAACDYYGYPHQVLTALRIFDINPMSPEQMFKEMTKAKAATRDHYLFKHRLASGEIRDVEIFTGPITRQDKTLLFSIIHDVTDRVQAEEMRQRVEGMIRHDIKSPLSGIIGLSALVREALPRGKTWDWAQTIHETSSQLYTLIGLNLDIFKMEQGLYELQAEPCDLAHLLLRLDRSFGPALKNRDLTMPMSLDGVPLEHGQTLPAWGNPVLLETMFSNLLQNALEASPAGAAITVTLRTAPPEGPDDPGTVAVAIHNLGAVPPNIRERFFEKYATSGKVDGTGLGTYSALMIAEVHGGAISFTSSETDGTRVLVTLPVRAR